MHFLKDFCGLVTDPALFEAPIHSEETMISPAWRHRGPGQQIAVMKTKAQCQLLPGGQTFGASEAMPLQRWPVPESDRTKPPRKIVSSFFRRLAEPGVSLAVLHSRGRCFSPVVAKPTGSVALYAVKIDFMMKTPNAAENGCRRRGDESLIFRLAFAPNNTGRDHFRTGRFTGSDHHESLILLGACSLSCRRRAQTKSNQIKVNQTKSS